MSIVNEVESSLKERDVLLGFEKQVNFSFGRFPKITKRKSSLVLFDLSLSQFFHFSFSFPLLCHSPVPSIITKDSKFQKIFF